MGDYTRDKNSFLDLGRVIFFSSSSIPWYSLVCPRSSAVSRAKMLESGGHWWKSHRNLNNFSLPSTQLSSCIGSWRWHSPKRDSGPVPSIENATITDHFGFVFEEDWDKEITWLSWRHRFRKALFSKRFTSTRRGVFKFLWWSVDEVFTPYNDLYGEASPERGTFFRLQIYKRLRIPHVEVYKRVGK